MTKLIVLEPDTAVLADLVRGRSLATSRIGVVEVKAVARANPDADPQRLFALPWGDAR